LRLAWWAWQDRIVKLSKWNVTYPTVHVYRLRVALALTRVMVQHIRSNEWGVNYLVERAEANATSYEGPSAPRQDDLHPIELQALGARAVVAFGYRARFEFKELDRNNNEPGTEWQTTKRTQGQNEQALSSFNNASTDQFVGTVEQRSPVFTRFWLFLIENSFDLLATVMAMHQAPALDALRHLERRADVLYDRLFRDAPAQRFPPEEHIRPVPAPESVEQRHERMMDPALHRMSCQLGNPKRGRKH
jgi:hypothetical protein